MFIITGAFYTWEIKGSYDSEVHMLPLDVPLIDEQDALVEIIDRELQRLSIPTPSGGATVKRSGTSFQLEWTGSKRDVVLEPTADGLQAKLTVKETSWYRNFVQLHKAKGGQFFKVYAALLAVSLFTILISGFIMAWQVPNLRKMTLMFSGAGIVIFLLMHGLS